MGAAWKRREIAPRSPLRSVTLDPNPEARRKAPRPKSRGLPDRTGGSGPRVGEDVALFAVHDGVDAGDLVLVLHAEADRLLDGEADELCEHERVDQHREGRDRLDEQLRAAAAVDEAGAVGEEAQVQGSDQTTDEVDAHHIGAVGWRASRRAGR